MVTRVRSIGGALSTFGPIGSTIDRQNPLSSLHARRNPAEESPRFRRRKQAILLCSLVWGDRLALQAVVTIEAAETSQF